MLNVRALAVSDPRAPRIARARILPFPGFLRARGGGKPPGPAGNHQKMIHRVRGDVRPRKRRSQD